MTSTFPTISLTVNILTFLETVKTYRTNKIINFESTQKPQKLSKPQQYSKNLRNPKTFKTLESHSPIIPSTEICIFVVVQYV